MEEIIYFRANTFPRGEKRKRRERRSLYFYQFQHVKTSRTLKLYNIRYQNLFLHRETRGIVFFSFHFIVLNQLDPSKALHIS